MHKKFKKNYEHKSFDDIQWEKVSEEKTNLAYDNGVKFLEDLDVSQKNLDGKALVFLSYLFAICGAIIYNLLFKKNDFAEITFQNGNLSTLLYCVCGFYAILFCIASMVFLSMRSSVGKYCSPKDIFSNSNENIQHIKNDLCLGLEESISFNLKKYRSRSEFLKNLLLFSVIIPMALIAYFNAWLSLFFSIFASLALLVFLRILFRFYP
jgi:hypothetical protein